MYVFVYFFASIAFHDRLLPVLFALLLLNDHDTVFISDDKEGF